jgi:uncharacterized lipoprotein YddW (UPF0748 family)
MRCITLLLALPLAVAAQTAPVEDSLRAPEPLREFRGVWVATVNNLDWPSRPDLPVSAQQAELVAILDRMASLKMNAIVFQVRPEFDAMYQSSYEPWSRYLTGRQGRPPSPLWDPLAFAIDEAHRRGIELHAWINPYRAAFWRDSLSAANHVTVQRPELVRPYSQFLWMDPGLPESRALVMRVIVDIVRRYDVDGIHIDDYFYPYPEERRGQKIPFPDAPTFDAYRRSGGPLDLSEWRRGNVDDMVRELYATVKAEKPWVKVGISPFGIWRPGVPVTTTAGIDQYEELYADVRKWLNEGWLDYVAPQLYWPAQPADQAFAVLLRWWVEENLKSREVWPGLALYKLPVVGPKHMSADDIVEEIALTRAQPGANGHVMFNARVLMNNVGHIADRLAAVYAEPALVPRMSWLDSLPPERPEARIALDSLGTTVLRFQPGGAKSVMSWLVRSRVGGVWHTAILPGPERTFILNSGELPADVVSVAAVDRVGNVGPAALVRRTP